MRRKKLMDSLYRKGRIKVQEAADLLEVSPATIRRFFAKLESEGAVVRTHGGIQLMKGMLFGYSYLASQTQHPEEKRVIAERAVEFVSPGDLLFLDSGTTLLNLAEAMVPRFQSDILHDCTVVTNSLVNYEILSPHCTVILTGGEVRLNRRDTCGRIAEKTLESLSVHKAFLGADAVHPEKGLMATDERTCRMNETVRAKAEKVFVLAGSEKFGKSSLLSYGGLTDAERIFTDNRLTEATAHLFKTKGAVIEIAGESEDIGWEISEEKSE